MPTLFNTEVNVEQLQLFQFENAEHTVDTIEIEENTLHIQIFTEGEPEITSTGWYVVIDNRLITSNRASIDFINKSYVLSVTI